MSVATFLKRVMAKPFPVILFRSKQEAVLQLKVITGYWRKKTKKVEQYFYKQEPIPSSPLLISSSPVFLNKFQKKILADTSSSILSSQFKIFGYKVPDLSECNFSADWRFKKEWPNQYYKKYKFYEEKKIPYDVKFPWELSRLHYLVPVLASQWAGLVGLSQLDNVSTLLLRWREQNPLAYSVNWYPMEASMRIISLVMLLDFVRLLRNREREEITVLKSIEKQLLVMLVEHGEFVWANREFTDVRGNHFTANLVALLLASYSLNSDYSKSKNWQRYAVKWLDREITLQFCPDGVNFEKSCGYHKLVLELFMLAAIARERRGEAFSGLGKSILINATRYSDAVMRPDGRAANFGDTDDAIALPFYIDNPRSHGAVVELARAYFDRDIGAATFEPQDQLASLFIVGKSYQQQNFPGGRELINFPAGGYIIIRNQDCGFFFMVDVGEVGMAGRGGHGHNDLLAFELFIEGQPIVLDPGCSGYTADLFKKNSYRRTSSHATLQLFEEEIARFSGHWGICNDAHPLDVDVCERGGVITIRAGHDGYDRFCTGIQVWRTFEVMPEDQQITIIDEVNIPCDKVKACWNFPLGSPAKLLSTRNSQNEASVEVNKQVKITVDQKLSVSLTSCHLSHGYGQEVESQKIIVEHQLSEGIQKFLFHFSRNQD